MAQKGKHPKSAKTPAAAKQPASAAKVAQQKQPRTSLSPQQISGKPLCWRFSSADRNGPWAWSNLSDPAEYMKVQGLLHDYEGLSWDKIVKAGSHFIQVDRLAKEARDRLAQLELDDLEHLMSFRFEGDMRVFCLPEGNLMHVFWYDPKHEVCPSPKKHT